MDQGCKGSREQGAILLEWIKDVEGQGSREQGAILLQQRSVCALCRHTLSDASKEPAAQTAASLAAVVASSVSS